MSPGTGILSTSRLAPSAGQRMAILHQRSQLFRHDVSVNLGRRDVGMTQHELHATQIGAGFQQMTGEGVTQYVRRDARGIDAGDQRRLFQKLGETLTCEMPGSAARRSSNCVPRRTRPPPDGPSPMPGPALANSPASTTTKPKTYERLITDADRFLENGQPGKAQKLWAMLGQTGAVAQQPWPGLPEARRRFTKSSTSA